MKRRTDMGKKWSLIRAGKRFFGLLAGISMLGFAVAAGLYWERNTMIGEARFAGQQFTTLEELHSASALPTGTHPDSVDYQSLKEDYRALPWIRDVKISVDAGGLMLIHVIERDPLARLVDGGIQGFVDSEGVRLPLVFGAGADLPLLYGFRAEPAGEVIDSEEFQAVRNFLLSAREGRFGWATISEVAWSQNEGVVALTQENGVKLLFGGDDFDDKLKNWKAFYREVVRERGIDDFSVVDLRFRNQVVTREM